MIAVCFEIRKKIINTLCGQNVVVLVVKPVGAKINPPSNLKF
jgi:hypothetical protein